MTNMETINNSYVDIEDLGEFIRCFNYHIQTYGVVHVATLMQAFLGHYEKNYTDYAYGWTEQINAKDHFEIVYPEYGNKLPYFKLNLPDYKYLKEQV